MPDVAISVGAFLRRCVQRLPRRCALLCCGAQNFCAALRRALEILTAATRSIRFIRRWRRSFRSLAMTTLYHSPIWVDVGIDPYEIHKNPLRLPRRHEVMPPYGRYTYPHPHKKRNGHGPFLFLLSTHRFLPTYPMPSREATERVAVSSTPGSAVLGEATVSAGVAGVEGVFLGGSLAITVSA